VLDVKTGSIAVFIVPGRKILVMPIKGTRMRVRIWTNRPTQADQVTIGFKPACN
jgi:hypothetical protein